MQRPALEKPDLSERGSRGSMDRRLFMQLICFTDAPADTAEIVEAVKAAGFPAAVYEDARDPSGLALLTMSEDPSFFVTELRQLLRSEPFEDLTPRPEMTMFGRTYSLGYEPDLEETLFERPRRHALNADWPWVVWYPLRRKGEFNRLPADEQRSILMEHGTIGRSFGEADLAHDVRLACHGLDENDNDFVIGLMGKDLHPLSAIVQTMRGTQQTALYIEHLGPFFVGRAIWQSGR